MTLSLRFRLALWYAASLTLLLVAFGSLLYGVVRYQLLRHHDGDLLEAAALVEGILARQEDCALLNEEQRSALDQIGHLVLFHEMGGEGQVYYRSPDSAALALPPGALDPGSEPDGRFETVAGPTGTLRVHSRPYRARSGRRGVIHVLENLGDVPGPLATLRLALLLMAPLTVLFSAAGGHWLAGHALSPVDQITRTAREIEATSLSRRLPAPPAPDEIGRLTDTLNQMIARLEASFEGMRRFTADASHELRSPLATMRSTIDVALARPREAGEYPAVLASVGEDVDRLRTIVADLLVLARADAGRVEMERAPVRFDLVVSEVADSFQPLAEERSVSISTRSGGPVLVLGDERWLHQLVANLVDNAVKFAAWRATGGRVEIELSLADGRARLSVADSGPGIPEQALARVFERFYRADASRPSGGPEGSGLGLAIAAWITETHSGRIAAANRSDGGAVFTVSLPLAS